jgi:hypothetical protein
MTEVREARAAYDQAREDARALVDRKRALLGQAIVRARAAGTSQTAILTDMKRSREQIRAFERAYRDWQRDHDGESLD